MPIRRLSTISVLALLVGCAATDAPRPTFDAQSGAAAQAATFIGDNGRLKPMATIKRVGLTSCNVLFAFEAAARSSTAGGLFSQAGGVRRAEASVSVFYTLNGLTDADMQRIANDVCANAERRLAAAGFEVVPRAQLVADDTFRALLTSGKPSPFEYTPPGRGPKSKYKVFAAEGLTVYEPRYIGAMEGLAQAFKGASGDSAAYLETRAMKTLDISAVNVNVLIDFAELKSEGEGRVLGIASRDTASVQHAADLGVTGEVVFKPASGLSCWDHFGKLNCLMKGDQPTFQTKQAITTRERFYTAIVDATTTGDKVAGGVTKALSVVAALGGVGGVASRDITRYRVDVEPAQFAAVAGKSIDGFLDMALARAREAR